MAASVRQIKWITNQQGNVVLGNENVGNIQNLLDATGPGFCLAKFTQVTMHLGTGMTHACHHPKPHIIPLNEINTDPAALFNTSILKKARTEMLSGARPSECEYCWRVEDNDSKSDRFYKSLESWALTQHDTIVSSPPDITYKPTYLEVSFSNVCNFKCTYCGPEFSTKWVEDLKHSGPIKLLETTKYKHWSHGWQNLDDLAYKNREFNPYVDAFWKWWPEIYSGLKHYRITGGEPLLSKETFRSIDWLLENPNTDLDFAINSNLGVPEKIWAKFIDKISQLSAGHYVKKFTVYTSVDAWGQRAEYARPGMDFELFKQRYEQLLQLKNVRAVIMCTFNIFSITSIIELFRWHLSLKKKYNYCDITDKWEQDTGFIIDNSDISHKNRKPTTNINSWVVGIDIPYLRSPSFLDAKICTDEMVENFLIPSINFMAENTVNPSWINHNGFEQYEFDKFKRIVIDRLYGSKKGQQTSSDINVDRAKFYDFVNELDRRSGSNFLATFPEMADFYYICKAAKGDIANTEYQ